MRAYLEEVHASMVQTIDEIRLLEARTITDAEHSHVVLCTKHERFQRVREYQHLIDAVILHHYLKQLTKPVF